MSAVVALLVTLPQSAAAHGPAPGDLRPQWLIDAMGAIDRWREQRHANQFFGTLYGKRAEALEPLLAPGGPCGASPLAWAFREMTARNTADGVVLEARAGFDLFFGMESSTIARSAMEAWSWDACARGAPRRMEWRGRDSGLRVAVDINGVAEVFGADGRTQRTSDPDLGLVLGFPCQSDSDCVLLRESCDPGRQRSAFAKRAPYFEAWRAAPHRSTGARE